MKKKKNRKNKLLIRQKEILARNKSFLHDIGSRGIDGAYSEFEKQLLSSKVYGKPMQGRSYGIRPDKGLKGGSCNVTACQEPNSAFYFNKSTKAYYCRRCADEINWPGGRADCMKLYGVPLLCELDEDSV